MTLRLCGRVFILTIRGRGRARSLCCWLAMSKPRRKCRRCSFGSCGLRSAADGGRVPFRLWPASTWFLAHFNASYRVAGVAPVPQLQPWKNIFFRSKRPVWMLCADCCVSHEPHSNSGNEGKLIKELRVCILLVFNFFCLFLWRNSVTTTCLQCSIQLGDAGSRETFQPLGCPRLFWMCPRAPLITTFHARRTLTVCLLQCFFFFFF